ncbi:DUF521 domain-containing protein [Rhodococcus sp. BP-316]|nr:DUF521 domain-containing protein [Rhodococcus sp. BP-316]
MTLTGHQRSVLAGAEGGAMRKVMHTLVRYGAVFGARRLVALDGPTHVVTSMGMAGLDAAFDLLDTLVAAGVRTVQPFTVDPRPYDLDNVDYTNTELHELRALYPHQDRYENQLRALGLKDDDAYSCTAYLPETGNTPREGQILSWAESSAVIYANSVLGARTNRNSGLIELMGAIAGYAPEFGLLLDSGRRATWNIEIRTTALPSPTLLGAVIGARITDGVPYIRGLDGELTALGPEARRDYLKDFGAAAAAAGAVGLFHIHGITPEARRLGPALCVRDAQTVVVDDTAVDDHALATSPRLDRVEHTDSDAPTVLIGCPHLSKEQLVTAARTILDALAAVRRTTVSTRTILSTAPTAARAFRTDRPDMYDRCLSAGISISAFCPALHMNCPSAAAKTVITNSQKLRTYTTSSFFRDGDVLDHIVHGTTTHATGSIS